MAGAEIVGRYFDPPGLHSGEDLDYFIGTLHGGSFGHFELAAGRSDSRLRKDLAAFPDNAAYGTRTMRRKRLP